jgi:hypothetical protein
MAEPRELTLKEQLCVDTFEQARPGLGAIAPNPTSSIPTQAGGKSLQTCLTARLFAGKGQTLTTVLCTATLDIEEVRDEQSTHEI